MIYGGVGVCICLKIGDIFTHRPFPCQTSFPILNLLSDREQRACGKFPGTAAAAEDAAAVSYAAVTVGAGHAAVQREAVYLFSKTIFQFIVQ